MIHEKRLTGQPEVRMENNKIKKLCETQFDGGRSSWRNAAQLTGF
jgi:hypothetical protein